VPPWAFRLWSVAARSSPLALASERLAFKKVRYHYSHLTGTKGRARSALTVEKFDALAGVNAYQTKFLQGATLVPRNCLLVETDDEYTTDMRERFVLPLNAKPRTRERETP
jgi:hypothetical protein